MQGSSPTADVSVCNYHRNVYCVRLRTDGKSNQHHSSHVRQIATCQTEPVFITVITRYRIYYREKIYLAAISGNLSTKLISFPDGIDFFISKVFLSEIKNERDLVFYLGGKKAAVSVHKILLNAMS